MDKAHSIIRSDRRTIPKTKAAGAGTRAAGPTLGR
ncbi:hypothetical protein E9232_006044 [Inquilinus ginsengisoli]|jgi:hypothetical protein|uniref:Uncharacterized protein n=1 Tax=Inquilinus ginsengisoli TaxID=363840 RepID=A0ABU1JXZ4_9PROT|nr:hypothetical protein [Inquilinus ginsengisoli]